MALVIQRLDVLSVSIEVIPDTRTCEVTVNYRLVGPQGQTVAKMACGSKAAYGQTLLDVSAELRASLKALVLQAEADLSAVLGIEN